MTKLKRLAVVIASTWVCMSGLWKALQKSYTALRKLIWQVKSLW